MRLLALTLSLLLPASDDAVPFHRDAPTFDLRLPSSAWTLTDQSAGTVLICIFSPVADFTTRCTVMRMPRTVLPNGLETREPQLRAAAGRVFEQVGMEDVQAFGRDAKRWEYKVAGATTIEWAFEDGDAFVIFQLAAPATAWDDASKKAELEAIRDSFVWTGGEIAAPPAVALTSVSSIRAQRRAALAAKSGRNTSVDVARHTIVAKVEPDDRSFEVDDTIEIAALEDDVRTITFYTSVVTVDRVTCEREIDWRVAPGPNASTLTIDFIDPLAKGDRVTIDVHAAAADFILRQDQNLVAEISVVGQVRPHSSWSSHVLWYPFDEKNDAAVDITFDVPEDFVALTGGTRVAETEHDGRRRFRYVEERRIPRQLPFGFAVGVYVSSETTSKAGLRMSVYGFNGEEKRIAQRIEALEQAAAAFEAAFGPLPWNDVRFVHVKPEHKETGVSLPGMILVSDGYFPDLEGVDLSDGNLDDRTKLGLLVVADELSHQWNFYASAFPNELAEGVSTFTNALFVEQRHDHAAYRNTIAYCKNAWIGSAGADTEFAIADPKVYSNSRYRPVVFCKTPVVLDALRRRLGDELFFAGLRAGFAITDLSMDGFDRLEQGFATATKTDLRPFFDRWFFRAGFPTIEWEQATTADGVRITVRQTQKEDPYALDLVFDVECTDGTRVGVVMALTDREQSVEMSLSSPVKSVTLDDAEVLPARVTP